MSLIRVALPTPLRRYFDYLIPTDSTTPEQPVGCRVLVPFGRQQKIGLVIETTDEASVDASKLKAAIRFIDNTPLLPQHLFDLGIWAANYYQHPAGDALFQMLPTLLRKGEHPKPLETWRWQLSNNEPKLRKNAIKHIALYNFLTNQPNQSALEETIAAAGHTKDTLKALEQKLLITKHKELTEETSTPDIEIQTPLALNNEQQSAVEAINNAQNFQCFLLDGVTGSGKTEVYLQAIAHQLKCGKQALVLVPEIGLTPQTVARFEARFSVPISVLHSNLTDLARLSAWDAAKKGHAKIVIGTRSALFTPLANPGIIIIDEEHDASFKQQEGYRYHGRDLAVMRAHREKVPVVLGSATPSFESLYNVSVNRYEHLRLRQRAGKAQAAPIELINMTQQATEAGLAKQTVDAMAATLAKGEQVLVFINRRGYAPSLNCRDCGWIAECTRCDARMTLHRSPAHLHCHHCERQTPIPRACGNCGSPNLEPIGSGTERTEDWLANRFSDTPVYRIDRDSTSRKGSLQAIIDKVHTGSPCILVGTQMLAKGHHFPDVTLVVIANADGGLFSADFRGMERTAQLITQVAGRAGRAEKSGKALLQTMHDDHPALLALVHQGYAAFAKTALIERKQMSLPPYSHYALLRAEASTPSTAEGFLQDLRHTIEAQYILPEQVHWLGPLPSPLERRAGMHRAQLIIYGQNRKPLHQLLATLVEYLEQLPSARKLRWSLDIDPADTY